MISKYEGIRNFCFPALKQVWSIRLNVCVNSQELKNVLRILVRMFYEYVCYLTSSLARKLCYVVEKLMNITCVVMHGNMALFTCT
jgi:hypothetical protein